MSGFCAFRELFQENLQELVRLGGRVSELVTVVNVYQGSDTIERTLTFREWVENELFLCEQCRHEFRAHASEVEEDDLVLCPGCTAWQRGYHEARGR